MPVIFFIVSIFLQSWLSKNEFIHIYKMLIFGIAAGALISILTELLSSIYFYSAYQLTILLKSIFIDGLLYIVIISASLYYIFNYLIKTSISANYSLISIMVFSFICGIFTFINFKEAASNIYPDYLFNYFSFLSYILLISFIIGFGYFKYVETYGIYIKIFWIFLTIILFITVSVFFNYYKFYNSIFQYLLIIPAAVAYFFFEIFEFRYFRK